MAKDSKYNIEKERLQRNKYRSLLSELPPFVNDFLSNKEKKNVNTALAYAQDLMVFFKYLKEFCPLIKDKRIRDIEVDIFDVLTYRDINEYQEYLSIKHNELSDEYNNNIRGIARKMSALRGLCKYLLVHHEIDNDPTAGADETRVNFEDHEIIRMNASEVNQLLQTVIEGIGTERQKAYLERTKKRDYAILYLLLNTGIRVSECVGLDVKDINFNENSIKVYRKGKKENILYFDDDLADILLDYINNERDDYTESDKEQALFLSTRKTRLSTRSIQQIVEKYAGKAVSNKNITPHKLRSTYGTVLYNQTGDIRLVADVLGHSSVNTTAKYYAAVEDSNRRKAAKIKPYNSEK